MLRLQLILSRLWQRGHACHVPAKASGTLFCNLKADGEGANKQLMEFPLEQLIILSQKQLSRFLQKGLLKFLAKNRLTFQTEAILGDVTLHEYSRSLFFVSERN